MKKIFFAIIILSFFAACSSENSQPKIPLEEQLNNPLPENYKVTFEQGGGKNAGSKIKGVYFVENSEITAFDAFYDSWGPPNIYTCEIVIELGNLTVCECIDRDEEVVPCEEKGLVYDENDYSMEELYSYFDETISLIDMEKNGSCYTNTSINGLKTEEFELCFKDNTFYSYEYSSSELGLSSKKEYILELT